MVKSYNLATLALGSTLLLGYASGSSNYPSDSDAQQSRLEEITQISSSDFGSYTSGFLREYFSDPSKPIGCGIATLALISATVTVYGCVKERKLKSKGKLKENIPQDVKEHME